MERNHGIEDVAFGIEGDAAEASPRVWGPVSRVVKLIPNRIGPVERIADHHAHPGECAHRHVSALYKGEATHQSILKNIQIGGEREVGFVDISQRRRDSARDERATPIRGRATEGIRAVGVQMDRHGSGFEPKILPCKWSIHIARIPSKIDSRVGNGKLISECRGQIVENRGNSALAENLDEVAHPIITLSVAAICDIPPVDIGPAPETFLLDHERVVDHGSHHRSRGAVKPCWKQHPGENRVIKNLGESAEVRIFNNTRGLPIRKSQGGNLTVYRSLVAR